MGRPRLAVSACCAGIVRANSSRADTLTTYTHPGLRVVDEVGHLTYGTDAANMLFHVVNDRRRRKRSMNLQD